MAGGPANATARLVRGLVQSGTGRRPWWRRRWPGSLRGRSRSTARPGPRRRPRPAVPDAAANAPVAGRPRARSWRRLGCRSRARPGGHRGRRRRRRPAVVDGTRVVTARGNARQDVLAAYPGFAGRLRAARGRPRGRADRRRRRRHGDARWRLAHQPAARAAAPGPHTEHRRRRLLRGDQCRSVRGTRAVLRRHAKDQGVRRSRDRLASRVSGNPGRDTPRRGMADRARRSVELPGAEFDRNAGPARARGPSSPARSSWSLPPATRSRRSSLRRRGPREHP